MRTRGRWLSLALCAAASTVLASRCHDSAPLTVPPAKPAAGNTPGTADPRTESGLPRGTATITGYVELNGDPIYPMQQNLIWLDPNRPGRAVTLDTLVVDPDGRFRAEQVPAGSLRLSLGTGLIPLILPVGYSGTKEINIHAQDHFETVFSFASSLHPLTFEIGDTDARQLQGGELVACVMEAGMLHAAHPFWRHRGSNVLDARSFAFQGIPHSGYVTASLVPFESPSRPAKPAIIVTNQELGAGTSRFSVDFSAARRVSGVVRNSGVDTTVSLFPGNYRWPGHGIFLSDQYLAGAPTVAVELTGAFAFDRVAPGNYTLVAETRIVELRGAPVYCFVELPVSVSADPVALEVAFTDQQP